MLEKNNLPSSLQPGAVQATLNIEPTSLDPKPQEVKHALGGGPVWGAICGLAAAVGYAAANVALKQATQTDAILVATSWRPLPFLLLAVSAGQLIGNSFFQISLGIIGLALAVPLSLSAMIMGGAICGRLILGERVSRPTILAIVVLIVATFILSAGGKEIGLATGASPGQVAWGITATLISGVVYAFFGTAMRKSLREGFTVPLAMMLSGITGVVWLMPIAIYRIGIDGILTTSRDQWIAMTLAGVFNMAAFFLLSFSLRAIPVVAVNLLNATQAALATVAGVWLFAEPLTASLITGCLLTVLGLVILGTPRRYLQRPWGKNLPVEETVSQ
jgi:drug/metabolite transporter (DMT)-like permease